MKSYVLALAIGILIAMSLLGSNPVRAMENYSLPMGECRLTINPSGIAFCDDIDNCSDGCTLTSTYGLTARAFTCNQCSDSTPDCRGTYYVPHDPTQAAYLDCEGVGCSECEETTDAGGNRYCECME